MQTVTRLPTERVRRVSRRHNEWTLREHEVVISNWPDKARIRELLPHRSLPSIEHFAGRCHLRKPIHFWTAGQDARLRRLLKEGLTRKQIAAELGMTLNQVSNRMQYSRLVGGRRPPAPTGDSLRDSIRRRLFDMNMTTQDLDEACGTGHLFQKWSPARRVALKQIAKALKVLDGHFTIEWSSLEDPPPAAAQLVSALNIAPRTPLASTSGLLMVTRRAEMQTASL